MLPLSAESVGNSSALHRLSLGPQRQEAIVAPAPGAVVRLWGALCDVQAPMPHYDCCYVLTALSFILSGGCAGFSRSEEGYQSRHQIEGPKAQASGPVPVLGAVVSPGAPRACPVTPLSFHLSHFRYPPLPSPHPGLKLAPDGRVWPFLLAPSSMNLRLCTH